MTKVKQTRRTPDIMGNLMAGMTEAPESNKTIQPVSNKVIDKSDNKTIQQETLQAIIPDNQKACTPESNTEITPAINKEIVIESNNYCEPENQKTIKPVTNKASLQESNKTTANSSKEKATFNLETQTLSTLEDVWISLRKNLKDKNITKTLIVEKAIGMALEDLESKGEASKIYKKLLNA